MFRLYVERKPGFTNEADRIFSEIKNFLGISGVTGVRYLNRYDVENISEAVEMVAATRVFSEPQSDFCIFNTVDVPEGSTVIVWEYLPGQYDQRADSAEQCLSLLRAGLASSCTVGTEPPRVRCAKMVVLSGNVTVDDVKKIENYLINPVDSRLTDDSVPETLEMTGENPNDIPVVKGFISFDDEALESYRNKMGLAMDFADIRFLQDYFKGENRDPTETEIRVLDTYWSDHCRHTTFLTELKNIKIEDGPYANLFRKSLQNYTDMRTELYAGRTDKPVCLMDMAVIGMKYLKKHGKLDDMEVSEENNACSIYIDVHYTRDKNGKPADETERWLLMFKNETHNHPTEIEPFGGAATCIGGAIRDPLSGRSWVYQSMRVTGAADPTVPLSATRKGKLPQIKICREAAQGFSSYGNQIGLTTGQVTELYHPGYMAKRMELGAVIAAAPLNTVMRERPEPGDVVILLGGGTGRDGIGGATGSSKVHTEKSVSTAAAEVQKGNAVEERKIQRLFRNKDVSLMIRRCNDFGAGGVSVAVGELAPGLDINLDAVPKKYDGLNGTELAISESQERMAVVVRAKDAAAFIKEAAKENLQAVQVAVVTDTNRLVMKWRGNVIVDIGREFLDAAGAHHEADALIESPAKQEESPLLNTLESVKEELSKEKTGDALKKAWLANISDLSCCSQRGLGERFDGSIGASTVLFPYGGKYQCTPEAGMCAKIPVVSPYETSTVSFMAQGYDPRVGEWSAWHGAQTAVLSSLAKIACMGGKPSDCRLSFQEFFGRAVSEKTWGYPAAALLGSIDAQTAMGCASIGGKDSMSGTFEEINVPHTLVSFAVTHGEVQNVTSGSFKKAGDNVYLVTVPYSAELAPDFDTFTKNTNALYELNKAGKIAAMYPVCAGGIAEAITKMAMGNRIGIKIDNVPYSATASGFRQDGRYSEKDLFTPLYGSIIVEAASDFDTGVFVPGTVSQLGATVSEPALTVEVNNIPGAKITLKEAESAWESTLSSVFPPVSGAEVQPELPEFAKSVHPSLSAIRKNPVFNPIKAKPRVVIPVFPGTNCEYDIARAFNLAGADTNILVLSNKTPQMLEDSLAAFEKELKSAQILALAGGFSAGDEPDGSAKFIANCLREGRVSSRIMELLKKRDGLVLGICNGFQALVKTGLAMYGEFRDMQDDMPTLTFNRIGRHISRVVRTRLVSAASPWALDPSVIDPRLHLVPVSHGEGRFVVSAELAEKLFANGQVFSQYVDEFGIPAVAEPDNPNGSAYAIEGITSPDGRVLGKMGHSERTVGIDANGASRDLIKNIAGDPLANENENSCENVFAAGVRYFK
ncbi:MAG: phosphoribosylformylglycinamidine synthase [Treponema porcinum]|uniref:Phosphoribosylformylglycinamidine synthase n=1 Tax=Treponema porcinum TaxID=261392 RepID=A0A1T4JMQ7_TREPO|nr:phosphoribosylformylglycinamidine synthase [Treponema porcinum]MDY5121192.1 phosphoribosylformylglycinamidine synthase [Treponema porcinum]SJZ31479.1 phosphoribosylformylglycinamidine synthase [Treponema porcinum]